MRSPSMAASRCSLVLRRHGRAIGRRFELSGAAVVTWAPPTSASTSPTYPRSAPAATAGSTSSVNCAGITAPTTLIEQCSLTKWRQTLETRTIRPDRGGRGPRRLASQKGVRSRPPAVSTCPAAAQPTDDALATVSRRRHLPPEVPSVSVERTRENLSLMCEFDAQRTLSPLRAFDTHQSKKQLTQTNQLVNSVCEAEKVAGGLFSVEAASNPHSRT